MCLSDLTLILSCRKQSSELANYFTGLQVKNKMSKLPQLDPQCNSGSAELAWFATFSLEKIPEVCGEQPSFPLKPC